MSKDIIYFDLAFGDSYGDKEGPERNYTDIYSCTLRSIDVDPVVIADYRKCPQPGQPHRKDRAARVVSRNFQRVDDTVDFDVTINYSTNIQQPSKEPNPLNRRAVIDMTSSPEMVPTFFDGEDNPRLNTAGDLIVGYRRVPFLDISVQKNVADYPEWMWDYDGTVNRFPVTIRKRTFPSRTLRMEGIESPDLDYENGVWFYRLNFRIRHDPRTFDDIRYSMGFNEIAKVDTGKRDFPPGLDPATVTIESSKKYAIYKNVKRRITIGTPAEYPTDPEFLDKDGARIELQPDRKGRFDLSRLHVLRFKDDIQTDFSKLPFK